MSKKIYERWRVDLKRDKDNNIIAEKLKLVKDGIKITDEQAAILNEGTLKGESVAPVMYYLAEEQEEPKKEKKAANKKKEEVPAE